MVSEAEAEAGDIMHVNTCTYHAHVTWHPHVCEPACAPREVFGTEHWELWTEGPGQNQLVKRFSPLSSGPLVVISL